MSASVLLGCTKTITVEQQPYEPRLAIESLLMPGQPPRVYLSTTVPFFSSVQTPSTLFARGASITIDGPGGADALAADSTFNKFWCRWEPYYEGAIPITQGATYELELAFGGQTFSASAVTDLPAVTIDSVSYVTNFVDIYGGHEGVVVDFVDIPGRADQYRFEMIRLVDSRHETVDDREYSSVCLDEGEVIETPDVGRFVYFDDRLDGAPVRFVVEPAHINFEGDVAFIYVQSLDRNAAEFYDRLDRQRESNINPFIEPVFLNEVAPGLTGVFGAMNRSEPVRFVFPLDSE
ncbi:MAG: DUF4249 family protein [Rhodothermales bacterium]|nr:DUF4249 family protein [Rhodothermales bacterium]